MAESKGSPIVKSVQKHARRAKEKKSNKGKCGRFKNREKEKMNEEKQREKLRKKKASDVVTKMKPGICMNYISVIVDNNLINCKFGGVILSAIVECGSSHIVKSQCIPYSITWNRKIVDENGSTITEEENFALIVWDAEHFLTKVEIDNVQDSIRLAQNNLPGKSLTLAIYNLEKYLKKDEENKIKNSITKEQSKKKKNRRSQNFHITRLQVEELFIELQLLNECSTWILNTVEDVGNLISQFTKAVAEKPYKTEKQMQQVEGLGWLATCDLKGVVRVDKSGNGLLKLWQQQLMQFNNSGLDVAQAITEQYPTPLALYKAYCLCNNSKEGEELLKDIRIRRGFGEVATTRRIGPELSKKIYYFFNSHDANLPLSQD
ncbi:methyl methanesulfonate sensitivity 4 isoform X2 [Lycorma delicatula]|uniref:methyl methanesulfonate sensitivity 4 isoform X2 n=1 Tax=Lycorma delicatula TaxID=130591 RepID=UPI003F50E117